MRRRDGPVLVTGASGLIGSAIVRSLLDAGRSVRCLVRPGGLTQSLDGLDVEIVRGDVLNPTSLTTAMADASLVFHSAAYFTYRDAPAEALEDLAVRGALNVLKSAAAAGAPRVILTSSSVVLGCSEKPRVLTESDRGDAVGAHSAYVRSKIAQDRIATEAAIDLGLELVIACPTMTLGPHPLTLGPSNGLITAYLADPFRLTFGGGCNLVGADDVGRGHVVLADHGTPGQRYILASENLTWPEIHDMISVMTGSFGPGAKLGAAAAYVAAAAAELQGTLARRAPLTTRQQARMAGRYYWYSHARAAVLGFRPAPARLVLARTLSWLVSSPHVSREARAGMRLGPEIWRARRAWPSDAQVRVATG